MLLGFDILLDSSLKAHLMGKTLHDFAKGQLQWPGVKRREKGRHFLHSKHFTSWSNFSIFFISEINRSPSMNAKPFSIERYVKLIKSITKKGTIKKHNQSYFFMVS